MAQAEDLLPCITCAPEVRGMLTNETIALCNQIALGFGDDDCGLIVQISDRQAVQAALGLPSSPVRLNPGDDEDVAVERCQHWVIARAHEAPGVSAEVHQVGGPKSTCWHHLSIDQAMAIPLGKWMSCGWVADLHARGMRPVARVFQMIGPGLAEAEVGRALLIILPKIFG